MSNDLLFSIGLDVADLKTSAKAAKEQADEIKKGFKGFKDVLEAGGVAAAVYSFFNSVIDYAKESKDAMDPNIAAVKQFGEGLAAIKESGLKVGVTVIGAFNRLGSAIGDAINIARQGWSAWAEGEEKLEATAAAAAAAEKSLAEAKKHADEFKKITEALVEVKKQEAALALQGITKQETLNNLTNDYLRIGIQLANGGQDALTRRKLELELAQAHLAMGKAELDVKKEDAQLAEKADKEAEKSLDEQIIQFNALGEVKQKEIAYARSKLSIDEQTDLLTKEKYQLEKQLLDKNISLTKETETRNRLLEITKQLDEKAADDAQNRQRIEYELKGLTKEQLEARIKIVEAAILEAKAQGMVTAELEKQLAIIKNIKPAVKENENAWTGYHVAVTRTGTGYRSQSTEALKGVRDRLNSSLSEVGPSGRAYRDAEQRSDYGGWLVGSTFKNELAQVEAELALRRTVQNYSARYGEDAAVRQYGDEVTQRAFKDMAATSVRTQNAVEGINTTLNRIFTK